MTEIPAVEKECYPCDELDLSDNCGDPVLAGIATWAIKIWSQCQRAEGNQMGEHGGAILVGLLMVLLSFVLYWSIWSLNGPTGRHKTAKQGGQKAKARIDSQS
jgi:hypothetical protein